MEVGHLLVAVFALVREDTTATLGNAKLLCHFADRTHEPGQLRVARLLSEIGIGDVRSLRDDENMYRRLRIDILERERVVVLPRRRPLARRRVWHFEIWSTIGRESHLFSPRVSELRLARQRQCET